MSTICNTRGARRGRRRRNTVWRERHTVSPSTVPVRGLDTTSGKETMRRWPLSLWCLIFALALTPLQGFVAPLVLEVPCGITKRVRAARSATTSSRSPAICPLPTREVSKLVMPAAKPESDGDGVGTSVESKGGDKEREGGADDDMKDVSAVLMEEPALLAATGASGALVGWSVAHSLSLDLDFVGAVGGCVAAAGLLAQDGAVGKATREVGRFALGAFDVITVLAKTTDVPVKVAETVGEEFLEVVEFTSGAVTKGYLDSLPPPNVRLEAEVATSKRTVTDLRDQLEKVKALLAEAKAQLAERAENKRMVKSAKDTASDLAAARAALAEKDEGIAKNLQLARREKETFDRDLKAAKAETLRFREMAESRADMDDNFKALAKASDTLEERVREYERRLRVLTEENDSIRADYSTEIKNMETERVTMRERITTLESSLSDADTRLSQERAALEGELSKLAIEVEVQAREAEAAKLLAAEMKAAVAKSVADNAIAVEQAAAEASKAAAQAEKSRAAREAQAVREQAAAARKAADEAAAAAAAEKLAVAAEMKAREKQQQQRLAAEEAREKQAAKDRQVVEAQREAAAREKAAAAKKEEIQAKLRQEQQQQQQLQELRQQQAKEQAKKDREPARSAAGGTKVQPEKQTAMGASAGATAGASSPGAKRVSPPHRANAPAGNGAAAGSGSERGAGAGIGPGSTSKEGLMKLKVVDLRERCKRAGMVTTGKKADLVERLAKALVSA